MNVIKFNLRGKACFSSANEVCLVWSVVMVGPVVQHGVAVVIGCPILDPQQSRQTTVHGVKCDEYRLRDD